MPQPYEQPRFVGFADVLGYKAIVRDSPFTDAQRFHKAIGGIVGKRLTYRRSAVRQVGNVSFLPPASVQA